MVERTPALSDAIFTLGMKSGAATTLELIRTCGWELAADVTYKDMLTSLTDQEHAILADAFRRIAELRAAPADPSPLHGSLAPTPASCPDSSCRVCPAIGGQAA